MVMKTVRLAVLGVAILAAGAFATETQPANPSLGAGKVVTLDEFFNHQEKGGKQFHYVWEDPANSGFSKFGDVWKENGAQVEALRDGAHGGQSRQNFRIYHRESLDGKERGRRQAELLRRQVD